MKTTVIKKRLKELGMLQRELAEATGISIDATKQIINGHTEPSINYAMRIAKAVNSEVEELFGEGGKAIEI